MQDKEKIKNEKMKEENEELIRNPGGTNNENVDIPMSLVENDILKNKISSVKKCAMTACAAIDLIESTGVNCKEQKEKIIEEAKAIIEKIKTEL